MATFLTDVPGSRPETPFSAYVKTVRDGGKPAEKPKGRTALPSVTGAGNRSSVPAQKQIKDELLKAEKKKEIEALKQKKKEIDKQLRKSMIAIKFGGEADLRPMTSSLQKPPMPTTNRVEQSRNTNIGPNPGAIKPGPTNRVDKLQSKMNDCTANKVTRSSNEHVCPPQTGLSGAKMLMPFDPSLAPRTASRGGLSRPRTSQLPYAPPPEAFRNLKSAEKPPPSRPTMSRLSRNVQGVASRELKAAGTEVLALVHDDTASEYRRQAELINPKDAMGEEPNGIEYTTHRVTTPQVLAEMSSVHNTTERSANLWAYGEGKPYPKPQEDDIASQYNRVIQVLKDRMYQRGSQSLAALLNCKDVDRVGSLPMDDVKEVLEVELNLPISGKVVERLINSVAKKTEEGNIVIQDFVNKLRTDKIGYVKQKPPASGQKRVNPDHALPFGNPDNPPPFGIMTDSKKTVSDYDHRIKDLFGNIKNTFREFDKDGSGQISWNEFRQAIERIDSARDLKLSAEDIKDLFRRADRTRNGQVSYDEFIRSFAVEDGMYTRFLPEFMKPRVARCSIDQPKWWTWSAYDKHADEVKKIGSRSFDQPNFPRVPTAGSRVVTPYALHPSAVLEAAMR
uniref:EF-hand domain-containing protein n=1 Tax=Pyramimonas obovata TaxID=1411642 RepID=A0A7S0R0F6_9CHLO|mmetsp:Transcript_21860/g.47986  ORF Transcript_21860/g.47986 Transcript_21860/m.47986 type:complete len:620 (+) Transcript_21860:290-2149(+)